MLEQDYLMRQIMNLVRALVVARQKKAEELNPAAAAESLEQAITAATELDGVALLSLAPESMASVMRVSGVDPRLAEYIARAILLESVYLKAAGNTSLAALRENQAHSLAQSYNVALPDDAADFDALCNYAEQAEDAYRRGAQETAGCQSACALDGDELHAVNANDASAATGEQTPMSKDSFLQQVEELERLLQ